MKLLTALALLFLSGALAQTPAEKRMLDRAKPYAPMIDIAVRTLVPEWDDEFFHSFLRAQIEQESLWNPNAQLKTSRELGRGFCQLTITPRFNAYVEVKALEPRLRDWDYINDPFNPEKQVMGCIAKNRANHRFCHKIFKGHEHVWGCTASAYNGGAGGVQSDRRVCGNTQGCDPFQWFSHVETTSLKQKVAEHGYGKSFFQINREYARFLVYERRRKYVLYR